MKINESQLRQIIRESINEIRTKKQSKTGKIQNKEGKWVDATEDGQDKNGNPMYRTKDPSITYGRKCKDGSRRVQDFNFRPNVNESQLKRIIKESIKQVLMEGGHLYTKDADGNVYTTSKETWRGIPNTTFVSHGEWSDPEIIYQGCSLNYYDVEELLEYNYQEDVKSGYQGSFEDWIDERDVTELESILDSIVCEY